MEKAGVTCVDCHMSALGFRTAETSIGKQRWTVASHEFRTSTPMMERDGESRSSCTACHIEPPTDVSPHGHLNVKPKLHTLTSLSALYEKRQADIARRIATLKTDLAAVDTTVLAAKKEYDAAMALLRMIEKASGNGVHNFARTNSLLLQAQKLADLANSLDAPGSAAAAVPKASPTIRSQPNVAANPPVKRAPAQKLAP